MKGRARPHLQLAGALVLVWAACERGSRVPGPVARAGSAIAYVSPSPAGSVEADGSASRPFAGLQQALSRAPSGALLRLEPGTLGGPFLLPKTGGLPGARREQTRLTGPIDAAA